MDIGLLKGSYHDLYSGLEIHAPSQWGDATKLHGIHRPRAGDDPAEFNQVLIDMRSTLAWYGMPLLSGSLNLPFSGDHFPLARGARAV